MKINEYQTINSYRLISRYMEYDGLKKNQQRTLHAYQCAKQRQNKLHVPDRWLNTKTYELSLTEKTDTKHWLPLRCGDAIIHTFNKWLPIGRHPMLYIGEGMVVGMINYRYGRGKMRVEKIDTELYNNKKKKKNKRRKKPRLCFYSNACHDLTNEKRLQRLKRVMKTASHIYKYHLLHFNCQHMCWWWLEGKLHSPCVERAKWFIPVLFIILVTLFTIITIYFINNKKRHK